MAANAVHASRVSAQGSDLFDPNFTERVISSMGPKTDPRLRSVMSCLIRHLHDFVRETELTVDEWMQGVQLLNWAGKMSIDKRNEGQLLMTAVKLVDEITFKATSEATDTRTQSAILGPFFRTDHPLRKLIDTISFDTPPDGQLAHMYGRVLDVKTRNPIAGAKVDVWQASTNGIYEQQDENQVEHNLRGKFFSEADGRYAWYCLKLTPYSVPDDGPAGRLLQLMDRHPFPPAHIHVMAIADGYEPITTQISDAENKYLDDDSMFAVKDNLVISFVERDCDAQAKIQLEFDLLMVPLGEKASS